VSTGIAEGLHEAMHARAIISLAISTLIKEKPIIISSHGNAQGVTQWTQILHDKLRCKECHDGFFKIMGGGDKDDVINIKQVVSHIRATSVDEE